MWSPKRSARETNKNDSLETNNKPQAEKKRQYQISQKYKFLSMVLQQVKTHTGKGCNYFHTAIPSLYFEIAFPFLHHTKCMYIQVSHIEADGKGEKTLS
jgi:hypothetical protein